MQQSSFVLATHLVSVTGGTHSDPTISTRVDLGHIDSLQPISGLTHLVRAEIQLGDGHVVVPVVMDAREKGVHVGAPVLYVRPGERVDVCVPWFFFLSRPRRTQTSRLVRVRRFQGVESHGIALSLQSSSLQLLARKPANTYVYMQPRNRGVYCVDISQLKLAVGEAEEAAEEEEEDEDSEARATWSWAEEEKESDNDVDDDTDEENRVFDYNTEEDDV